MLMAKVKRKPVFLLTIFSLFLVTACTTMQIEKYTEYIDPHEHTDVVIKDSETSEVHTMHVGRAFSPKELGKAIQLIHHWSDLGAERYEMLPTQIYWGDLPDAYLGMNVIFPKGHRIIVMSNEYKGFDTSRDVHFLAVTGITLHHELHHFVHKSEDPHTYDIVDYALYEIMAELRLSGKWPKASKGFL